MSLQRKLATGLGAILAATVGGAGLAFAQDAEAPIGISHEGQIGMQPPATSLAVELENFHNHLLMPIITVITIFVMALLIWVIIRYNAKSNPVPSKTTHNTLVEVLWTVIPVLILVAIAIPSFQLLYRQLIIPTPDLTIRAIGHQWYWSYEYPDNGNFTFDANLITADAAEAKQKNVIRLLDTDNEVVLPVGKNIRVQITAADVIHSWTVPSFGIKHDAVPGRVNESWFNIDKPGIYYGQCSELCGLKHGYMPIKVRAVSEAEFTAWVAEAQGKFDKLEPAEPASSSAIEAAPAETAIAQSDNTLSTTISAQPAN